MSTVQDASDAVNELRTFVEGQGFVKVHAPSLGQGGKDAGAQVAEIFQGRRQKSERGLELIRAVGTQIANDNGVKPGSDETTQIPLDQELSDEAERRLKEFRNFIS